MCSVGCDAFRETPMRAADRLDLLGLALLQVKIDQLEIEESSI